MGSASPSSSTVPADVLHPAVQADEAVAERGLAAARLARQAHDLAVGDLERGAIDRLHVAREACGSRPAGR